MMITRQEIQEERKLKGFCQCHECVERDYESAYHWEKFMGKYAKSKRPDVKERLKKMWADARKAGFKNLAPYKQYLNEKTKNNNTRDDDTNNG